METNKETIQQPKSVKFAVILLWASALISLLTTIVDPQIIQSFKMHTGVYILAFIIVLFFAALLITKISAGRNWARIVFILLAAVSAILFLRTYLLSGDIKLTNIQVAEGFVNNALGIFISKILLSKHSSEWFSERNK